MRKEDLSMIEKITAFPNMMYLMFTGFIRDFKRNEKGLSGVVVAILLILIAVLAIVLIWGFLSGWLVELWEKITGKAVKQSLSISAL
jgi:Flp pilus assembly pilin Flp